MKQYRIPFRGRTLLGWCVLVFLTVAGCTQPDTPPDIEPDVSLIDAEALEAELEAAKGKPLVVNIWATWCKPCVEEMPEFVELYEARDDLGIGFLSLSADMVRDVENAVRPFTRDHALPFPVYVLDGLPPEETAAILGVTETGWDGALPATFVLDPAGALVKDWQQSVTTAEIEAVL